MGDRSSWIKIYCLVLPGRMSGSKRGTRKETATMEEDQSTAAHDSTATSTSKNEAPLFLGSSPRHPHMYQSQYFPHSHHPGMYQHAYQYPPNYPGRGHPLFRGSGFHPHSMIHEGTKLPMRYSIPPHVTPNPEKTSSLAEAFLSPPSNLRRKSSSAARVTRGRGTFDSFIYWNVRWEV